MKKRGRKKVEKIGEAQIYLIEDGRVKIQITSRNMEMTVVAPLSDMEVFIDSFLTAIQTMREMRTVIESLERG